MCCLINHVNMHSLRSIIEATEKLKQLSGNFPGGGGICTAFPPREEGFEQKLSKNSNARGVAWGDVEASI